MMNVRRYGIGAVSMALFFFWTVLPCSVSGEEPVSGKTLTLSSEDSKRLAILGDGVVGKALPAFPLTGIRDLMPLMTGEWVYRITTGEDQGGLQTDSIGRSEHTSAERLWRRMVGKKYVEYFRVIKGDKVIEISETDLSEHVLTHYNPPIVLMFDGLKPGQSIDQEIEITVYDLNDPGREKYRGKLRVKHSYAGAYEVSVPAGRYETVLLKSTFAGKVGPAEINDFGYVFFSKDMGVVASLERMHVGAFLFYNKTTRTPKILLRKNP